MSRHYQFESFTLVTGSNADKRVPVKSVVKGEYVAYMTLF